VVCRGDARKSALHVIVIDEIDAVFRKRTAAEDSGEATRSSVVNQILAKLDGVNAIPNVLFVGMTNRRELLDDALLRPGRMEVQIEIPLPNKEGRREILQIHFNALRQRGRLSKPLCCAIDGVPLNRSGDDNDHALTGMPSVDDEKDVAAKPRPLSKRKKIKTLLRNLARKATIMATTSSSYSAYYDLAAKTDGYSGADIAGLVRSAGSLALARARKDGTGVQGLLITLEDVMQALVEVKKR
jgi:SpoVK/Ycf46/Vps4 family AAA+-type ATPase